MGFDLVQIRGLAQKKEDENWRFREFLKRQCDLEPDEIDKHVFETYKPDFVCRTMAMVERTFTCPIVYNIMEDLKKSLGFSRRPRR